MRNVFEHWSGVGIRACLLVLIFIAAPARAELVSTVELSCPALSQFPPGSLDSFFTSALTGPSAYNNGTLERTYINILKYTQASGGGRFGTFNGTTRYGVGFDTFQLFQSFLTPRYFTAVSSGNTCPGSGTYNWLFVRYRTPEVSRGAMDATDTTLYSGGVLDYNGSSTFSGTKYFSLAAPNSPSSSASYSLTGYSGATCGSGKLQLSAGGSSSFDPLGTAFFGGTHFLFFSQSGNPQVALGVPQVTLSSGGMAAFSNFVFTGLYTEFNSATTQTQYNIQLVPDAAGTTYAIRQVDSLSDASQYTALGTLTCPTLNQPFDGFCKGSLSLAGVPGSTNVECEVYPNSTENVIACAAPSPNNPTHFISIVANTPNRAVLQVEQNTVPELASPGSTTFNVTIKNLTGRYIPTMGDPSSSALLLAPPFSAPSAFGGGGGGACGTSLKGFASCTITVTYAPQNISTHAALYRVAYDTGADGTMNAMGLLVGTTGMTGLSVSAPSNNFVVGSWTDLNATATYSNGLTQNVSSVINWSTSASAVGTVTPYGTANFVNTGKVTFTGALGSFNASTSQLSVSPPDPLNLAATVNSGTQITLSWASGGGATAAFQIAYSPTQNPPATCSVGTVISAATIGSASSYQISGLQEGVTYAFRVCSSDGATPANFSPGVTIKVATPPAQFIFVTSGAYASNFGGLYFADYICQLEASAAGRSGIWRAVLADGSTAASARIWLTSNIYNYNATPQLVSTAANFWSGTFTNAVTKTASGGIPASQFWSGTTNAGAVNSGKNCTNWTLASSATGASAGQFNATSNPINYADASCATANGFLCISGQTAAAAPPNPTGFAAALTSTTSIAVAWASGGGSTAAYQIAYRTGATAPTDCASNTVVAAATIGSANPNGFTITGLNAGTQYSFRLCAMNSDGSAFSSGVTVTASTLSTSNITGGGQQIFATMGTYPGNLGGPYFGDFICQQEAQAAGLSGIWRAALSDNTTDASSHVSIISAVYNLKPGGGQYLAAPASFWSGGFTNAIVYNSFGGTPASGSPWTGSDETGVKASTCSNWSSVSSGVSGSTGSYASTVNPLGGGSAACNLTRPLLCVSGQSAAATPPNPTGFGALLSGPGSLTLSWTSGGGTTAAYQIAYQMGATAPSDCQSGTVISAATIGKSNPNLYTLANLRAGMQFSLRLCALNSDGSAFSSGVTYTASTNVTSPLTGAGQLIFTSKGSYSGLFGGPYFADFICQQEAQAAGYSGVWKSLVSTSTVSAASRITLSSAIFNMNSSGPQQVSSGALFWSGNLLNPIAYNAAGGNQSSYSVWTGSTATGSSATDNCSDWSTLGTALAAIGISSQTNTGAFNSYSNSCVANGQFYCINGQSDSATPPNPTSVTASLVGTTNVGLTWVSGGSTTAAYQVAYQAGASAPANCSAGTAIPAATVGKGYVTGYTVTGLTPGTQYSFRVCAQNSTGTNVSSGVAVTATTTSSGFSGSHQKMFVTANGYYANFGGLYFGDFICQREAQTAGLTGTWRALLSSSTTSAASRLTLSGPIYNTSSAGPQLIANGTGLWSALNTYAIATPAGALYGNIVETGTKPDGSTDTGYTCSDWTYSGVSQNLTTGWLIQSNYVISFSNFYPCVYNLPMYCVSGQSSAATPPNPGSFAMAAANGNTITLSWASGGGTTAAYQIAYQAGASAPSDCNSGTVISAPTIGISNPNSFSVKGLTASTQYSFRLCAANSDLTAFSTGTVLTASTTGSSLVGNEHYIFATTRQYSGAMGGLYFADFICQSEAVTGGQSGTWKAVMSDETTAASSRISVTHPVYNLNAAGPDYISDAGSFWSNGFSRGVNYDGSGKTPTQAYVLTGSTSSGAINAGYTCNSWTSPSSSGRVAVGYVFNSSPNGPLYYTNTFSCSNGSAILCISGQTPAATPPDPTGFAASKMTSSSIALSWTSGGGTTAAYQIAYQSGGTAPSNCTSGTVISAYTIGITNPNVYAVSGLAAGTQYSFRLCATNSDVSAFSSGVTLTATTPSAGSTLNAQRMFITDTLVPTYFGGLYYGDFICQQEAQTAGLSGTWKAILSDSTTTALSRIALGSGAVVNMNPTAPEIIVTTANFWKGVTVNAVKYDALGGLPSNTNAFTATNYDGSYYPSGSCSDWTLGNTISGSGTGGGGTATGVSWMQGFGGGCGSSYGLYCIDGQSAAATPPDPSAFAAGRQEKDSIALSWNSGGGTTAAYQIAYKVGGSAPADCHSDTVVSAATIGFANPLGYTVTGLSAGTQYTFRLCALNSDASSFSSGVTVTASTTSSGSAGSGLYLFATAGAYPGNFGGIYFADYICQREAQTAALGGVWKAVLADSTNNMASRITLTDSVFDRNPVAPQLVSIASRFWNNTFTSAIKYNANGTLTKNTYNWTGLAQGGTSTNLCSDWTGNASGTYGAVGYNGSAQYVLLYSVNSCNTAYGFYCVNGQTAASAPPNPANFSADLDGATTVALSWTSGGGTTAAYQIAYQTGASAPADCNSGTVIPASTVGVMNPNSYTLTGLTAGTQYSFRICAANSDTSLFSSGVTATTSTTTVAGLSGTGQILFTTGNAYAGNFGGVSFADFICQQEAQGAGYSGIWRAVLSDGSNAASSRISVSKPIYNLNPAGPQYLSSTANFWGKPYRYPIYAISGGATGALSWSGSTVAGASGSAHCTNWTSAASGVSGAYGFHDGSATETYFAGNKTCNNTLSFFCINGQSAAAAPPNPTGFSAGGGTSTSLGLTWSSGGGSTAAYQIAYQQGSVAPANCTSGTVIPAATIGKANPNAFTVTNLTPGTPYAFRLCATNSDVSAFSSGVTLTAAIGDTVATQIIFATKSAYAGNFGGQYFADFICQKEANEGGRSGGVWKAILGSSASSASSRILTAGNLVNTKGQTIGSSLWSGTYSNGIKYSVDGSSPGAANVWTGSTASGSGSSNYCSDWTTNSSGSSGTVGSSTATDGTAFSNSTDTCDHPHSFYCISNQTPSAAPTDGASFTAPTVTSSSVTLNWASGSGTTAAYQIAYQTGASAPANCATANMVSAYTLGTSNPTSYVVNGLVPNTQYSFRLCAGNSDLSLWSSGLTVSATTTQTSTSNQLIFATSGSYAGNFGGLYFADFLCQNEARQAGYTGVWKALLSNDSTQVYNRIALSSTIYNTQSQQVATSSNFWSTSGYSNAPSYTASGGTPKSPTAWTGSTASGGIYTANTCSNWTSQASTVSGGIGTTTSTSTAAIETGTSICSNFKAIYCINQQSASAAPPNVASFTSLSFDSSSITLQWASGGGTTAAYQLAYQIGASAPADCNSGTTVSPYAIGMQNINSFIVSGLKAGQKYSFRLCAANSDLSSLSSGKTLLSLVPGQDATPAALSFSSASYDFGKTTGKPVTAILTLINHGSSAATSLAASTPALNSGFAFTGGSFPGGAGGSFCGTTLAAYSSCTLSVTFTPSVAGTFSSALNLSFVDGFGANSASAGVSALNYNGAVLAFSPTTWDFGSVTNGNSAEKTFTLTNSGTNSAQGLSPVALSAPYAFKGGTYPGTGGTCAYAMAASTSCTVVVTFSPTSSGSAPATLQVNYQAGLTSQSASSALTGSSP